MQAKSILLLDTERNVLQTYKAVLEDEGYSVSIAASKDEALKLLSQQSFAILITELYLKGVNTSDIIRTLKQESPDIYIIMVSAVSMNPDHYDEIINAGVDDYFTKPLSSKLLLTTIKKGMKRRSLLSKSIDLENKLKTMEHLYSSPHDSIEQGKIVQNMFSFNKLLKNEVTRSKRYNHPFSLIILKTNYNDKKIASDLTNQNSQTDNTLLHIINTHTRKTDFVLGHNGFFALILVETPKEGTRIFKDRIQQEISKSWTHNLTIDYFPFPEQSDYITTWIFGNNNEQDDNNTQAPNL